MLKKQYFGETFKFVSAVSRTDNCLPQFTYKKEKLCYLLNSGIFDIDFVSADFVQKHKLQPDKNGRYTVTIFLGTDYFEISNLVKLKNFSYDIMLAANFISFLEKKGFLVIPVTKGDFDPNKKFTLMPWRTGHQIQVSCNGKKLRALFSTGYYGESQGIVSVKKLEELGAKFLRKKIVTQLNEETELKIVTLPTFSLKYEAQEVKLKNLEFDVDDLSKEESDIVLSKDLLEQLYQEFGLLPYEKLI